MLLNKPFEISSRLLPALRIADATISLERAGRTSDGRDRFRYYIDTPAFEHVGDDLNSGVGGCSTQEAFGSLLSFLGACGESVAYARRTGRDSDNADLFPPEVAEWCDQNSDDISMLACELEESPELIID
jgi:hypothetical protein